MIFIEPAELYMFRTKNHLRATGEYVSRSVPAKQVLDPNAPLRFVDGWDEPILSFMANQSRPVRIMALVSQLRKRVPHRNKQHKEKLKRDILLRVGALIRDGNLIRIQRKFVLVRRDAVAS